MTRCNAAALNLDGEIGVIAAGAYADLVVLDARATPAMAHRMEVARNLEDELFVLMTFGRRPAPWARPMSPVGRHFEKDLSPDLNGLHQQLG